jgi:hypothetical protein
MCACMCMCTMGGTAIPPGAGAAGFRAPLCSSAGACCPGCAASRCASLNGAVRSCGGAATRGRGIFNRRFSSVPARTNSSTLRTSARPGSSGGPPPPQRTGLLPAIILAARCAVHCNRDQLDFLWGKVDDGAAIGSRVVLGAAKGDAANEDLEGGGRVGVGGKRVDGLIHIGTPASPSSLPLKARYAPTHPHHPPTHPQPVPCTWSALIEPDPLVLIGRSIVRLKIDLSANGSSLRKARRPCRSCSEFCRGLRGGESRACVREHVRGGGRERVGVGGRGD